MDWSTIALHATRGEVHGEIKEGQDRAFADGGRPPEQRSNLLASKVSRSKGLGT